MRDTVSPQEPLIALADLLISSVRTAVVCRIESYDPQTQTATITPMVSESETVAGVRVPLAATVIEGAPVVLPGSGTRSLTLGLSAGDLALALFRHRSHDEIDDGAEGPLQPRSDRRMNIADVFVIPGFYPPSSERRTQDFRTDGQPVLSLPGGEALHVGVQTAALRLAIAEVLQPYLSAVKLWLDTLELPVAGAIAGPPVMPSPSVPALDDLASGRVKVDT